RTGLDALGHPMGPADVARPYRRHQAVDRSVGDLHGFLLVVEAQDAQHRPEDLFLGDLHRWTHFREDRRLHEESTRLGAFRVALASTAKRCFFLYTRAHVSQDAV